MMDGEDWNVTLSMPQHHHHDHASDGSRCSDDVDDEESGHRSNAHHRRSMSSEAHFSSPSRRNGREHESDAGIIWGMQELHHRHTSGLNSKATVPHSQSAADFSHPHRYSAHGKPRGAQYKATGTRTHRRRTWAVWIRLSVLSGVVGYFVLMILGSQVLQYHDAGPLLGDFPLLVRKSLDGKEPRFGSVTHFTRESLEKERFALKEQTTKFLSHRAASRRRRTKPHPITTSVSMLPRRMPYDPAPSSEDDAPKLASPDDLCGEHARTAAREHPNSYLSRDILNSKSRVLITGILNPVGFHLALALQERCGVQVMFGIDPMYPNDVEHRIELQRRLQLLTTHIPKLVQPIVLPLVGLDARLNRQKKVPPALLPTTGELNLLNFNPTHIVHLASYSPEEYKDRRHPEYHNTQSPYVNEQRHAPLYRIRSNLASMEQLLASMRSVEKEQDRPHFVYASSASHPEPVHRSLKMADEFLADTYHSLHGVTSVGLRLPDSIFGPAGRPGTQLYELAKSAVQHWTGSPGSDNGQLLLEAAGLGNFTETEQEFLYVRDAVDAIISSMQFRSENSGPAVMKLGASSKQSILSIASMMESFLPKSEQRLSELADSILPAPDALVSHSRRLLGWSPTTSLNDGLVKMLAWHLDELHPYGDSAGAVETGDAFLARQEASICPTDDLVCNAGRSVLPCESECSNRSQCRSSIFDSVADLIRDITQDCDIILYTQSIGYDVKALSLGAKYMEEGKQIICNFAFVPRGSSLVKSVVQKVPEKELTKFGISKSSDSSVMRQRKLDGLNGRLLYKGWILIWLPDAVKQVSTADKSLLKLAPGKLFSKDVKHALFVDEKFPVTPNIDDVLFLVGETHRPPFRARSIYRKDEEGVKHKYKLAAEPERRAALLLAPLKRRASRDAKEQALVEGQKISVYEATKYMRFEIGENAASQKESPQVKKQREFYERIPSFTNRQDMRSNLEPWYRYDTKHWVRTRWIVHDMKLEDSRQLRCDWYSEHVPWNSDLDQLSFAHVMARRELERRIAHQEPDDHVKPAHVTNPILKELTDGHEWHALVGHSVPAVSADDVLFKVPAHMIDKEEHEEGSIATEAPKHVDTPLFVRIMSERVMLVSRKAWQEMHDRKKNQKKRPNNKKKKK